MKILKNLFRFRLRTLFFFLLIICCLFGWLTNSKIQHVREMASLQKFQLAEPDSYMQGFRITKKVGNSRAGMVLLGASN